MLFPFLYLPSYSFSTNIAQPFTPSAQRVFQCSNSLAIATLAVAAWAAPGLILASTEEESVPLNLELAIATPTALSPIFTLDFAILTTPNNGTPEENADAVFPTIPIGEQTFQINDREFTLPLVGFSQDEGLTAVGPVSRA